MGESEEGISNEELSAAVSEKELARLIPSKGSRQKLAAWLTHLQEVERSADDPGLVSRMLPRAIRKPKVGKGGQGGRSPEHN